jgi:hypothetical protein
MILAWVCIGQCCLNENLVMHSQHTQGRINYRILIRLKIENFCLSGGGRENQRIPKFYFLGILQHKLVAFLR